MVNSLYQGIAYFCVGETNGMLSLCLTLWNKVKLVLLALRELITVEPVTNHYLHC